MSDTKYARGAVLNSNRLTKATASHTGYANLARRNSSTRQSETTGNTVTLADIEARVEFFGKEELSTFYRMVAEFNAEFESRLRQIRTEEV